MDSEGESEHLHVHTAWNTECYQSQDSKQELLYCLSFLTEQDDLPEYTGMYTEKGISLKRST